MLCHTIRDLSFALTSHCCASPYLCLTEPHLDHTILHMTNTIHCFTSPLLYHTALRPCSTLPCRHSTLLCITFPLRHQTVQLRDSTLPCVTLPALHFTTPGNAITPPYIAVLYPCVTLLSTTRRDRCETPQGLALPLHHATMAHNTLPVQYLTTLGHHNTPPYFT